MWTYTGYVISTYFEKCSRTALSFNTLAHIFFGVLRPNYKLILLDGEEELYRELEYLRNIGIIDLKESKNRKQTQIRIKNNEELNNIVKLVKSIPDSTGLKLLGEYQTKIDNAFETINDGVVQSWELSDSWKHRKSASES
jgi:hypothetical protein